MNLIDLLCRCDLHTRVRIRQDKKILYMGEWPYLDWIKYAKYKVVSFKPESNSNFSFMTIDVKTNKKTHQKII